jgi:hypothetical protein
LIIPTLFPVPHSLFPVPYSLFPGHPRACAVEEDTHAQSLGAFDSHQATLATDVVAALEMGDDRFIPFGIALQAGDALLESAAEAGTDLKAFFEAGIGIA